jgi:acetyl-CoA/propionyl-CoA carboxylase
VTRKISSVLIANRGEIALRVVRACKEMEIRSIAVYSDEDTRSVHVKKADAAYHIGPSQAVKSHWGLVQMLFILDMASCRKTPNLRKNVKKII